MLRASDIAWENGLMLRKYTLLRSQMNRVYELLAQGGLEPAEFSWTREEIVGSMLVSRLNYRDGTDYFQFSSHEVNAWCIACPGQFRSLDYDYPKSWEEQEGIFARWVSCLKREIASPDPWADLARYRVVLESDLDEQMPNEPISALDAEKIVETLARLANEVEKQLGLGRDEMTIVCAKFNYLSDTARWQKSRDWLHTALGVFVTIAAALYLPETAADTLCQLFRSELGQFIHIVRKEPLPPPKHRLTVDDGPAESPFPR